jgi:transcriptional regulator with XRE-family HTH domain
MSKTKQHSSNFLKQVMSGIDPVDREVASQRVAMAVRISDAITSKGMSKVDFAELMGKHPSEITKWLSGRHNFTLDTLSAIQTRLGVQLLTTEEPKKEIVQKIVAAITVTPAAANPFKNGFYASYQSGGYNTVLMATEVQVKSLN